MHQIEYKAAKLEAEKLQMSNESNKVYETYLDALEATKVQTKTLTTNGSVTYTDISKYQDLVDLGYRLYYVTESNGTTTYNEFKEGQDNVTSQGTVKLTKLTSATLSNLLETGAFVIAKRSTTGSVSSNSDAFTTFVEDELTSVSTDTGLSEVSDETNLKKAEAQYEADMKRIDAKDTKYDTELAALDTERNAVKNEMETLQSVAKENVERTFKLFS
jgi:phage terminase Nu1 subunit (DNA packaging protein)